MKGHMERQWLFYTNFYITATASVRFSHTYKKQGYASCYFLQSLKSLQWDKIQSMNLIFVLLGKTTCDWHLILICRLNMDYWKSSFRHGAHYTNGFSSSNSMEISFHSHLDSNAMITTKFCTWHDSCAVVACAKICCDLMASKRG